MGPPSSHSRPLERVIRKKKRFTPTSSNRATRTHETYVKTILEHHPPKRTTLVVYGLATFEHHSPGTPSSV